MGIIIIIIIIINDQSQMVALLAGGTGFNSLHIHVQPAETGSSIST
jgi:hypothetical protein